MSGEDTSNKRAVGWKRPLFGLVTVLLFFGIVEGVLWVAGVSTLLEERDPFLGFSEQVRVFQLNEERGLFSARRRAVAHSFNYQEFAADKPDDGFRVFVLGGSSAYGFPWGTNIAFTRPLEKALQAVWPGRSIEAVNAAAMSYGSHRLRILARELLQYEPDLLIVYGGHNEFVERRFYRDLLDRPAELDRFRKLLYRSRLYSLMTRAYEGVAGGEDAETGAASAEGGTGQLLGLDVVREYSVEVGAAEAEEVRGLYEENLRAIVDLADGAGVRVLLCTVPSNLTGWIPNQSLFSSDTGAEDRQAVLDLLEQARDRLAREDAASALARLEQARELDPGYAEVQFRLGQAYQALGRVEEAREAYRLARDLDGQPARATSGFNETVRSVAADRGTLLVDFERIFQTASPDGLVGFNLFEDYVHPTPEAHRLIAYELFGVLQEQGLLGEVRVADRAEFESAVGDEIELDTEARRAAMLYNLAIVLENQGLVDQAMEKYRACVALQPNYYLARSNLARLLHRAGRLDESVEQYLLALEMNPEHVQMLIGLGEVLRSMGRLDRSREVLTRATTLDPGSSPAWNSLGETLAQSTEHAHAEAAYRRAAELNPKDARALANLGFMLMFQNRLDDAEQAMRASLALQPQFRRALNGLAAVLTERGRFDEAEMIFRESVRLDPEDSLARGGLKLIEQRRAAEGG